MTRIGINGFGRIGRLAFRAAWDRNDLSIVHINEFKGGSHTAAHLLEFDSVHGKWPRRIEASRAIVSPSRTNGLHFKRCLSRAMSRGKHPRLISYLNAAERC